MNLRVERLNSGKTIRARAEEIGVKSHVLRYAEQGGCPRPEQAKRIADFYGVKVTDLWPIDAPDGVAA
jgi:lambda repressor-like predicted transcriptional regulator